MLPHLPPSIFMGFYFFPRGGSAQVARYLCRALRGGKWEPTLFSGSVGTPADTSNAERFFGDVRCESLDYSQAVADWRDGGDAMSASVPIAASYEDKPDAPDRIFFDLDNAAFDAQVDSWTQFLRTHSTTCPSVVHLHHLTPLHEAVNALWPGVPVVTHLHGSELKMLELACDDTTPNEHWPYKREWIERMRRWAGDSQRLVVIAAHDEQLVRRLLPVDPGCVTTISNGVDIEVFSPRPRRATDRMKLWKRYLVDEPQGWQPGLSPGSIRYEASDLDAFTDPAGEPVPVVVFAGRFLRFKRLQLLIEAHHTMRSTTTSRSVLVVVGGFPCEWEGEHPYDTVRRLGAEGVFFIGWRDHDDLAAVLNCSDVFAALSVDEPFGLVYLEAMASGVPPIATNTGGPMAFINTDPGQPTGWLVPPDDLATATRALTQAVSNHSERVDRGRRAAQFVRQRYSWAACAEAFACLYDETIDESTGSKRSQSRRSTSVVA